MTGEPSANTRAVLLLTAPLLVGRAPASPDLLSPGEYRRLARRLRELERTPADLLATDADALLRDCAEVADAGRLRRLLDRGFLLSQAVERWAARAIWVVSRSDEGYPTRLRKRLGGDAPPVLYGCGTSALMDDGGLAVVGSRHIDRELVDYTRAVGRVVAAGGRQLVSGGARGVDQAAMAGALEAGGRVCGVLADSLQRQAVQREHRDMILAGRLVLVSPYDPAAGFNVGHAMARNKLIYALADAGLVVSADHGKGGTWAGAVEQLDRLRLVPVYTRPASDSPGLDALRRRGALAWSEPADGGALRDVLDHPAAPAETPLLRTDAPACAAGVEVGSKVGDDLGQQLMETVRDLLSTLLTTPMTETEVAATLGIEKPQAKAWLGRLVETGTLARDKKPVRYRTVENRLL